jgi:hypothetical protein
MRTVTLLTVLCLLLPAGTPRAVAADAGINEVGSLLVARRKRRKERRRRRGKKTAKATQSNAKPVKVAPAPAPKPAPVAAPAVEKPEEKPGLAVLDMKLASGIDPGVGSILNETLIAQLDESGRFSRIIAGSDMRDMISLEQQKLALGCEAESCLAELGGALGVPYMFVTDLGRFGGRFIVNMKLLAVEESRVLARANKIVADEAGVLEALPTVMGILLAKAEKAGAFPDTEEGAQPVAPAKPPVAAARPTGPAPTASAPAPAPEAVAAPAPALEAVAAPEPEPASEPTPRVPAVTGEEPNKPLLRRSGVWLGTGLALGGGALIGALPSMRDNVGVVHQEYKDLVTGTPNEFDDKWSRFESARTTYNVVRVAAPVLATSGGVMLVYSLIWGG